MIFLRDPSEPEVWLRAFLFGFHVGVVALGFLCATYPAWRVMRAICGLWDDVVRKDQ